MTLLVRWKKHVKSVITLDPEDVGDAQNIGNSTDDKCTVIEMSFNSFMVEFLKVMIFNSWHMYGCSDQDPSEKSSNDREWFYTKSNHALTHQFS